MEIIHLVYGKTITSFSFFMISTKDGRSYLWRHALKSKKYQIVLGRSSVTSIEYRNSKRC